MVRVVAERSHVDHTAAALEQQEVVKRLCSE